MSKSFYILTIILLVPICWLIPQAHYAVNSFGFNYAEDLGDKTQARDNADTSAITSPTGLAFVSEMFEISAFTSSPNETSGNPCIAASGRDICIIHQMNKDLIEKNSQKYGKFYSDGDFPSSFYSLGIIACPTKYKMGENVFVIEGKKYICLDRMAKRYRQGNFLDLYMGRGEEAYNKAIQYGRRTLEVKIYD